MFKKKLKKLTAAVLTAGMLITNAVPYTSNIVTAYAAESTNEQSADKLAGTVLSSEKDLVAGSAKISGNAEQFGTFSGAESILGIDEGIVLSTGYASKTLITAGNMNSDQMGSSYNDSDLQALSDSSGTVYTLNDTCALEFKIKAVGETLVFNYVFASCEFDQDATFNDAFGLFVNGKNVALLPESNKTITIQNLKNGEATGTVGGNEYYRADKFATSPFNGISYVFTATASVTPGSEVTIKFVIADVTDNSYDSAVFIQAHSLTTDLSGANDVTSTTVTINEVEQGYYYALFDEAGNKVGGWTNTVNEEGKIVFTGLAPDTNYYIKAISSDYYNSGSDEQDVDKVEDLADATTAIDPSGSEEEGTKVKFTTYTHSVTAENLSSDYTYQLSKEDGSGATEWLSPADGKITFDGLESSTTYYLTAKGDNNVKSDKVPVSTALGYTLTLTGGQTAYPDYGAGDEVTITAPDVADGIFTGWEVVKGGVTLADDKAQVTTFTMPSKAVEIKANYILKPVFTTQPSNIAGQPGETVTISAEVSGGGNMTYQWYINRNDGEGFVVIPSADKKSYTTSELNDSNSGYMYKCVAENEAGTTDSNIVTLSVHEHNWSDYTYDEDNHYRTCSVGGETEKEAHIPGSWVIDVAATTSSEGSRHRDCKVCQKLLDTEVIPKKTSGGGSFIPIATPIPTAAPTQTPETPDVSVTPAPTQTPETPGVSVTPAPTQTPETPDVSVTPVPTQAPETPDVSVTPVPTQIPDITGTPEEVEAAKSENQNKADDLTEDVKKDIDEFLSITDEEKDDIKSEVDKLIEEAKKDIENAETLKEIEEIKEKLNEAVNELLEETKKQDIEKAKEEAINSIEETAQKDKEAIDERTDLTEEEKQAQKAIIDEEAEAAKAAVTETSDRESLEAVVLQTQSYVDSGNIVVSYEADIAEGAPKTNINVNERALKMAVLDEEEKQEVKNGNEARIFLEVKVEDITFEVSSEDKVLVEESLDDKEIGMYIDISLYKQIGEKSAKLIHEPGVNIELSIEVPEELINTDSNVTRTYYLMRVHNGETEIIEGSYNAETNEFTFVTDRFSTYVILYMDSANNVKDTVPKTGETGSLAYLYALAALCGVGMVYFNRRKEVKEN